MAGLDVSHNRVEQFVVVKLYGRWVEDGEQKRRENRGTGGGAKVQLRWWFKYECERVGHWAL